MCLDPDPADLREGCHRISNMLQILLVFWTLAPPICLRYATEFQKCGKSLWFLDPDPADLREACQFSPPQKFCEPSRVRVTKAVFGSLPRADIKKEQ